MAKTLDEIVLTRRSTRRFTGEHVSDAAIDEILDMAAQAPSSWGGHPVEFIVVRNRATLRELARCKAMGAGPVAYGDAAIVPIVDTRNLELWVEDAAVASTYVLLAAEHVGVGACWGHMRGRRGHTHMADEDIRDLLGIPAHYGILNVVSLGMRKDAPERRHTDAVVHRERY
jgi:nitroreductase